MPPQLAALVVIIFISYLLWSDRKSKNGHSRALWIPFVWMFLGGSRYVSQWLDLTTAVRSQQAYLDGSPLDRTIFLLLIFVGGYILFQRRLNWSGIFRQNIWVWFYFLFGITSILWSDYPDVSLKRWIKALGNVIMVLIILTEKRPFDALGALIRRLTFLWVPLSVLFIKYYPALGRVYNRWSYEPMFIGVATQKNELGKLCLITGLFFFWRIVFKNHEDAKPSGRLPTAIDLVLISMIAWLLYKADSVTSFVCLIAAVSILWVSRRSSFEHHPRKIFTSVIIFAVLLIGVDALLGIKEIVFAALGREPTLTTRVPMWEGLIAFSNSPIAGVGYESFWLGDRMEQLWDLYGALNQAHNGYLEVYLNLGLIGLGLLMACMISGAVRIRKLLYNDYRQAILRFCLLIVVILYNWAEATFYGVSNMWILFMLSIMEVPGRTHPTDGLGKARLKLGQPHASLDDRTALNLEPFENRRVGSAPPAK